MNRTLATFMLALSAVPALAQTGVTPDPKGPASKPALSVASVRMDGGVRASKIIGSSVYGDNDTQLGTVEDLMMTPGNQVIFAVVSAGGVIGIGGKLIAVPIGQLQHAPDGKLLLPGASRDTVAAMPTFVYG